MILPNRLLILSVFLCQSVVFFSPSLNAKEMPKESAASDAQSSVHAAVAYKQPNRVVVINSKIVRAVYDNNLCRSADQRNDRNVCGHRIRTNTQHYALA